MGKSKKHRNDDKHAQKEADVNRSDGLYLVFVFWLVSVGAYAYCWNIMISLEYPATVVGLTVLLAFTGILGSGGATDLSRFNCKNAVISMAFTLSIVTICMPFLGERINYAKAGIYDPDEPAKFAPLASSQQQASPVTDGMTSAIQQAMMGGLPQQSTVVKIPTKAVTKRAIERSKRFLWGLMTSNMAVVEGECTMELSDKVAAMELPQKWTVDSSDIDYNDIVCEKQSFADNKLFFVLSAGEGRASTVCLTEGLTWEVSDFDLSGYANEPTLAGVESSE